jgi:hypothetical protein
MIFLLQLGFHPLAVVSKLVQKEESDSYIYIYKRRNNTQKIQKNRIHKIENIHNKSINIKRILKKSQVIIKEQREANNNDTMYSTEPKYSYATINQ